MNTINREQFEAWLFSQSNEREFIYQEGTPNSPKGCLICNFFREQTNFKEFGISGSSIGYRTSLFGDYIRFDTWAEDFLHEVAVNNFFTGKQAKQIYLTLFPNAIVGNNDGPAIAANSSFNSIASVTESNATNMLNSPSKQNK